MPRATILITTESDDDWQVVEAWIERWRTQLAVCPEEPGGCWCCVAWWDVDASQAAIDELPTRLLASSEWSRSP